MALSKKPTKKNIDTFINAGGTAPKKEKEPEAFERLELRVPPEVKAGIKVFAALQGEKAGTADSGTKKRLESFDDLS